jgi:peptide/nickel transport system substrate-binding protein
MGTSRTSPSRRRRSTIVVGTLVVLTAAAGCTSSKSSGGDSGSSVGDALTFGTSAAPPTLNPATGDPSYTSTLQWAYDPLVVMKGDGTFAPGLATKWGYVGKGNMAYELTLRDGVKFSDGTPLNAAAVKTFLDYERTQKAGSPAILLSAVSSIDATGPMTVHFTLSRPDPNLTFNFAQAFAAGYIASPKAVADPKTLETTTAGAGPYMLDTGKTVAGDHYTFVQNPNYWNKGRQQWKTVTVRIITNPSSMIQSMQAGQIQAAVGDATTLQAARNAGITVTAPPQALFGLNLMDRGGKVAKPLADVRVRQALNLAVDRTAIAKALFGSADLALSQYALEGQPAYDKKLSDAYPHDVAKAKQLLSEAGYANGFTLKVLSSPLFSFDKLIQAIGGQLKDIGVTLQVDSKATANDYFTSMVSGKYPAAAIGYGLANMGSLYAGFVFPQGPFNPFHFADPQLDKLYAQYFSASEADSPGIQQQINKYLVDQGWTVPVVGSPLSYYTAKGVSTPDATTANAGVPWLTDLAPTS